MQAFVPLPTGEQFGLCNIPIGAGLLCHHPQVLAQIFGA